MRYRAKVYVTLKRGVLDPQGKAVRGGLTALGYAGVEDVRIGKFIEILVDAPGEAAARESVEQMCTRLLANPVIEDFRFEVAEACQTASDGEVRGCASA